jgi:protein-glutamine gamma-glutamyltransferase
VSDVSASPGLRLAVFAALSAFAAAHWTALVADPPVDRTILCVLALTAGGVILILTGRAPVGPLPKSLLAGLAVLGAVVAALLVIGMPARWLAPGNWGELGGAVRTGLEGIEDVDYPYAGEHPWSRLVILLALPLMLGAATALAFWPAGKRAPRLRALALAIVIGIYATAVITDSASYPLLRGLVLFLLVAAWLWLPAIGRRQALGFGALVAVAGAIAVPLASALNAERPWLDYRDWTLNLAGRGSSESFDWDHKYGPLDWPRTGKKLLEVRSETPHYWRAAVLDTFDGFRWRSSEVAGRQFLELPGQLAAPGATQQRLNPKWIDWIGFSIDSLRSPAVISAGTVGAVKGIGVTQSPSGLSLREGVLKHGDSYSLRAYVPDPSAEQMRRTPGLYDPALSTFTSIQLPAADGLDPPAGTTEPLAVPLRGEPGAQQAVRQLAGSPYAPVYALARRWTSGAPTAYDAVEAVMEGLRGNYEYSEETANRRYPLRAFLFADRVGYCQQFSGAMALMLRMIGIPSRVATGFSPGERSGDRFLVRDYDAHSWVEVYFNDIGWVAFDPTPPATPAQTQWIGAPVRPRLAPGAAAGKQEGVDGRVPAGARAGDESGGGMPLWVIPAALGLALLHATVPFVRRRRRCCSLSAPALAAAQLRELVDALRHLGWPIAGGTTLCELERRLGSRAKPAVAGYVAKLSAVRYGADGAAAPTLAQRRRVRRDLSSGGGLGARLRSLLAIPPGGPALPIR